MLERQTAAAQDEIEAQERLERIDLQQRPKIKFHQFTGLPEDFDTFMKDAKVLFSLYPKPEQRILKLANITSKEISKQILRYLASGDKGPQEALDNLRSKYGFAHINKPVLLQRLKVMKTAARNSQIPATAEAILTILKALANMEPGEEQYLPQEAMAHVFRALRLNQDEQIKVLPLLQREGRVTLDKMKAFTRKRHSEYSLWVRTFCQTDKDYKASLSLQQNGGRTQAGAALDGGDTGQKSKGRGSRRGKGGSSDGDKGGSKSFGGAGLGTKPPISKQGGGLRATPRCALCESQGRPLPGHW